MKTQITKRRAVAGAVATALAALAIPATSLGADTFGAHLTKQTQPSNGAPAQPCVFGSPGVCTRIEMDAYGDPGHERAPHDGRIKQIRLIAATPGHFKLQLAEAKPNKDKARVVAQGPRIDYASSGNGPYTVQKFPVDMHVERGDYLAAKGKKSSMLRCSSGGPNQFLFQPALSVGGPFQTLDYTDGCWLLLEAVYA